MKRIRAYLLSDTSFQVKIFYIVAAGALSACLVGALSAVYSGLPYAGSFLSAAIIALLMLLVYKSGKAELGSYLLIVLIDIFLFPYCFFLEGGIRGGVSMWYILSFFAVFLLVHGRWFWPLLLLSLCSMVATYMTAFHNPHWVTPLLNERMVYMDYVISVLIIGTVCGLIVRFLNHVYLGEQEKLLEQKKELERLSNIRNSFFANMSHEIRTPINTIIGLNEMTLREDVSEEVAENAAHIQSASKMLLTLVNDILDMSKIESGKMEIVPVQYETGAMFSDLINLVWNRAREKNLEFRLDISPRIPSVLSGDVVRIKQVLANLLSNAIKYTPKGSVTLCAHSEAADNGRILLTMSVSDTGTGIKKEDLKNLFHSFQRVDEASNVGIEGTGLGLSISRQLVELMGGKISVDSIYQKGSTFTVQIEQQVINGSPMRADSFMIRAAAEQRKKYRQIFEAPDARVLVVDDNEMNLLVAKKLLRETKIQVDMARSGAQCLELTRQHAYHVIFMDHVMPEMDGIETLRRLKMQENGLNQDTPVIVLTANVPADAEQVYAEKGFSGYLSKPVSGSLLETTLLKSLPRELVEFNVAAADTEAEDLVQMAASAARKKVCVTTDCVCDLPTAILEQYGIGVMPCYLCTKLGRFRDINEMSSDNLLEYLSVRDEAVLSETASVEEYESFFSDALDVAEQVIHISMTRKIGTGFTFAHAASQSFGNVHVVDSTLLSSAMGLLVLQAAQLAEKGYSPEVILQHIEELKGRLRISFIAPSIEPLRKKGKIHRLVYHACTKLDLHPIMTMRRGEMVVQGVLRGDMDRAYGEYLRRVFHKKKDMDTDTLFITYAGCSARQLKEFRESVEKQQSFRQVILQKTSATIASNCGLGAIGITYIRKKED